MRDPAAAWIPLDRALRAFASGDGEATLTVHTDLGGRDLLSVSHFFRTPQEMSLVERTALRLARPPRILDLGAGAGAHAVPLAERGLKVTAVEVLPAAVDILRERGISDVRLAGAGARAGAGADAGGRGGTLGLDALRAGERFDTILLLMNGPGLAGTRAAFTRFLQGLQPFVAAGGQLLADSTDTEGWEAPGDGRAPGELHMVLEFQGERGPAFPYLFLAPAAMHACAAEADWAVEVAARVGTRYLARLTPRL